MEEKSKSTGGSGGRQGTVFGVWGLARHGELSLWASQEPAHYLAPLDVPYAVTWRLLTAQQGNLPGELKSNVRTCQGTTHARLGLNGRGNLEPLDSDGS